MIQPLLIEQAFDDALDMMESSALQINCLTRIFDKLTVVNNLLVDVSQIDSVMIFLLSLAGI